MSLSAALREFIELLNSRGVETELAGLSVFMLSKDLLIQNKRAVGRPQDLADLDALS